MTCRQCQGIERFFDRREAQRELTSYRRKGPADTTKMLIDAIRSQDADGATLLDIGGGVGVIQHELLKAGAASAVAVEASTAYLEAAQEEAGRQGHGDRVSYRYGDFVSLAPEIEPADVVTLDRVICCYHDVEGLVSLSSQRARRLYGLVYPRYNLLFKIAFRLFNVYNRLRRNPFRIFLHPPSVVDGLLRANGLHQRVYRRTAFWQVAVYGR